MNEEGLFYKRILLPPNINHYKALYSRYFNSIYLKLLEHRVYVLELIYYIKNNKQKLLFLPKRIKGIIPGLADMLSEASGQYARSSRNDCPGMSERLSGAAGQNYKSIFIMLK